MWKLCSVIVVCGLGACASNGPSRPQGALADWAAYRANVLAERNQGKLDPIDAEELIEARYQQFYGLDPVMEGAFVYGIKLYEAADSGTLSLAEADCLAQARIDQALAHRQYSEPMYVFPPEASD
jgi:hypothetical protein